MEDLEYLESMKQSVATVIHIINLKFDPKKKQLFTVFEGKEDRTYYIPRIKILLKDYAYDEIVEVIAYCKNNVISVNESIDWNRYSYNQFIFFTDTDLDYWLNKVKYAYIFPYLKAYRKTYKRNCFVMWIHNFKIKVQKLFNN